MHRKPEIRIPTGEALVILRALQNGRTLRAENERVTMGSLVVSFACFDSLSQNHWITTAAFKRGVYVITKRGREALALVPATVAAPKPVAADPRFGVVAPAKAAAR